MASDGGNPNAFAGGQNIDQYSGIQNVEAFAGGGGAANLSPMLAFGVGASAVSVATEFVPDISDTASDTSGSTYIGTVAINGAEYYQFADIDGTTHKIPVDPKAIGYLPILE